MQNLQGKWGGQCAESIRKILGLPPQGDAINWIPDIDFPLLDSGIIIKDGKKSHIGIVVAVIGDVAVYNSSNSSGDERWDIGQTIKLNDPRIAGYKLPASWGKTALSRGIAFGYE